MLSLCLFVWSHTEIEGIGSVFKKIFMCVFLLNAYMLYQKGPAGRECQTYVWKEHVYFNMKARLNLLMCKLFLKPYQNTESSSLRCCCLWLLEIQSKLFLLPWNPARFKGTNMPLRFEKLTPYMFLDYLNAKTLSSWDANQILKIRHTMAINLFLKIEISRGFIHVMLLSECLRPRAIQTQPYSSRLMRP